MDGDDLPPGYHELIPVVGDKGRSPSPFESKKQEAEFHPLVGPESPSAPFLPDEGISTLYRIMSELPSTIYVKSGPCTAESDKEDFYLRDSVDILLVKGTVNKPVGQSHGFTDISMQNNGGNIFLQIFCVTGNCEVFHGNSSLGRLRMELDKPESVRIHSSYENQSYTVNFLSPKDIVISKASLEEPICKIHIPDEARFDGTIVFSDRAQVTAIEQCLCISVAFVFMAARNDIATVRAAESKANEKSQIVKSLAVIVISFLAIIVISIIIVILGRLGLL